MRTDWAGGFLVIGGLSVIMWIGMTIKAAIEWTGRVVQSAIAGFWEFMDDLLDFLGIVVVTVGSVFAVVAVCLVLRERYRHRERLMYMHYNQLPEERNYP